jgi:hypothetical protein
LPPVPLDHLALGTEVDPASVPRCAEVLRLAAEARGVGGTLIASSAAAPLAFPLGEVSHSGGLVPTPVGATYLDPSGPGEFALVADIPGSGAHEIWLGGSLRPSASLSVDGEELSTLRQQLNPPGAYLDFGQISLRPGHHELAVAIGGPDLHPGSAQSDGVLGPLAISRPDAGPVLRRIRPSRARNLCGKPWDWIEVVPSR